MALLTNFKRRLAPPVVPSNTPARKVGKATTYTAQGIQPPDLGSELGSSQPVVLREVVPELISPATRRIAYGKMLDDAGVDVSVRAIKTPVLGADYYMEPYSDDPQDILISEFVWANLAEGMSAPFLNSLEDVLRFFEDGFAILEKAYEMRSWSQSAKGSNAKNYTMLKKLGVRPESTISAITYDDNGGPKQITQQAIQGDGTVKAIDISIGKLMIFTFNRRGGDIRGKSILRTAYQHWYYKTHFYKIDAIQKERHSLGVPKGMLKPGYNTADKNILRTLLRNLRSNEEAFMLLTPNVDVEFAEIKSNLVNALESADHHNQMLLLNVMAQFLANASSGSSRSTAATQVDMFMKALRYIANYIADIINMYLIPELVVWNFPTTNFPKLQVKNLGETKDLQMLAAAFANLLSQGGIEMDDPTENYFRKVFDMPAKQPGNSSAINGNNTPPVGGSKQKGGVSNAVKPGNVGKSPSSSQ